ncbi:hypothetical protein P22_2016 [Propionispora sp. 2/2-37]|uniref:bifunctional homocysteine S-methyltransferase/methylenetetrahydrofolate reductase n=1 Tax=Propionispora sp. 2/2-37 TaxID=1677858 RepID=UPI0006BB8536|nr:bifunctional homocysteine S-methyltransferase/methylenetetrahydrofolate reductase [Propionispora sp. 2/2-37]CUH95928.1 hypothetical protein P22_2016 [Propionispora sp. 2/2-37]
MIREYVAKNMVIADGAMGTYYASLKGTTVVFSEPANLTEPELIESIHKQYIAAGARLIRTNTFSANTLSLGVTQAEVKQIIQAGYRIAAKAAAGRDVFVAADIGPVPALVSGADDIDHDRIMAEYRFVVDTFLAEGAAIFVFETFSSTEYLGEISTYIKRQNKAAFILAQFATTPDGFTRRGISNASIVSEAKNLTAVDAYGFNCGVGPTHLYNAVKKLNHRFAGNIISVLPNAGYPEVINERTVYAQNPEYFAEVMKNISALGVKIIGGCCGTTPEHIACLVRKLSQQPSVVEPSQPANGKANVTVKTVHNNFSAKLQQGEFVVAVELDPPFDTGIDKILDNAKVCRRIGVDLVTVADSPMAKARVDSIMLSAKIQRETGMETMPHICCRDKNLNALKSSLLAGHIEQIRNVLAVTGDSVSAADKTEIKSVFNLNSFKLIELMNRMNREFFADDVINIGGALNLNVPKPELEVARMVKKAEKGAGFFLTQPIFSSEAIDFLPTVKKPSQVKILGGIMPLVSYRNAMFLNNEIPGISIPEEHIHRFDPAMDRAEAEQAGIALAVEIARKIKPYVDGFYFITPFNRIEMVAKILQEVG